MPEWSQHTDPYLRETDRQWGSSVRAWTGSTQRLGWGPGIQGVPNLQTACIHTLHPTTNSLLASLWGPPQDLGSFLHWAVCLRSAYGGLAVSLPAPVPLLSSHLSVLLPESDFLCLLPPAPICVSQPQPLALSLWASVSVPNLCLWMCLAVSTCPSAFVQELACASPCPPFLSLSPLTAQLPITPSHSPCLSIPSCFLSLCCFFCLLVSI